MLKKELRLEEGSMDRDRMKGTCTTSEKCHPSPLDRWE